MIFADSGLVVVQEMLTGGFGAVVPNEKVDAFSAQLDTADIFYEMDYDYANVDDTSEQESTATLFSFGPDTNIEKVQEILDRID